MSITHRDFFMEKIHKIYRLLQAFSADVVVGSCLMCWLTSYLLQVNTPLPIYVCLGVTVWLIYTIDHLIDAKEIEGKAITLRHYLHQKHFNLLSYIWITLFTVTLTLSLFTLSEKTIYYGVGVAGVVVVHLFLVKLLGNRLSVFIQKELGVALGYTLGVVFGPISISSTLSGFIWIYCAQVLLLALINLHLFSYFDYETDVQQNQTSISRNVGKKTAEKIIISLLFAFAILQVVSIFFFSKDMPYGIQLILFSMYIALVIIFKFRRFFKKNDWYRIVGDGVFMFPLLLFLLA